MQIDTYLVFTYLGQAIHQTTFNHSETIVLDQLTNIVVNSKNYSFINATVYKNYIAIIMMLKQQPIVKIDTYLVFLYSKTKIF